MAWTFPEMNALYRRAVANQWDGDRDLDWSTSVDPLNPEIPIINQDFIPMESLKQYGIKLNQKEAAQANYNISCWMLQSVHAR